MRTTLPDLSFATSNGGSLIPVVRAMVMPGRGSGERGAEACGYSPVALLLEESRPAVVYDAGRERNFVKPGFRPALPPDDPRRSGVSRMRCVSVG